jgi:hypothetical protein
MRRLQILEFLTLALLPTVSLAMSVNDSIGAWRTATAGEREALSRAVMRQITSGLTEGEVVSRADQLAQCLNGVAGHDAQVDWLTIKEAAATCAVMGNLATGQPSAVQHRADPGLRAECEKACRDLNAGEECVKNCARYDPK